MLEGNFREFSVLRGWVNRPADYPLDYPGGFFAPPLTLLPPAEVAEDGQDQRHHAPDGQVAEGGARSPSEPDDACKEKGEYRHEREGEGEGPRSLSQGLLLELFYVLRQLPLNLFAYLVGA
jgi:hypothetical protein